jgi:acetyltransferase
LLESLFSPRSVAIVGASTEPGKLGNTILDNVIKCGFKGPIYPINPRAPEILGVKAYPRLTDTPGDVDLIIVVVPPPAVLPVMKDAATKGVKAAVIITAGFREAGAQGLAAERTVMEVAHAAGIRVVGPNCLGVIDTFTPLNGSFASGMPSQGRIAFASQSGALLTALLDWAALHEIGFSKVISLGNKADVSEIDLIRALQDDEETRVIAAYLEGITDGQEFMRVAREATRHKPLIIFKSGTTAAGSRAVSSHTGTLAGSEASYVAAFKQTGAIRAASVSELFDLANAFAMQPLPAGRRLAIVTNAGGPGIIATDAAEKAGLRLSSFTPETIATLREKLPATASVYNPVDIIGDAAADRYDIAIGAVLPDPGVDGVLVLLTPQAVTEVEETARIIGKYAAQTEKPILASFVGGSRLVEGLKILHEVNVPNYAFPEGAIGAFRAMAEYKVWQSKPIVKPARMYADRTGAAAAIAAARQAGRTTMGHEAMDLLAAYGFVLPVTGLARTADDAIVLAAEIGYPVVMKIVSPEILHKSDVGGVKVGLASPVEVRNAFASIITGARRYAPDATIQGISVQAMARRGREVILGATYDPQFGHLIMFGLGGIYVEVLRDVAFRVAPLAPDDAREMIFEIRANALLRGVRGDPPADIDAIVDALLRLSQLVTDFPEITELDVNPLLVYPIGEGSMAVDSRVSLAAPEAKLSQGARRVGSFEQIGR